MKPVTWLGAPRPPAAASPLGAGLGLGLALLLSLGLFARPARGSDTNTNSFHVAFSSTMFTEVNEDDARAAVKVWAQFIAKERGFHADPDALILKDVPATLEALRGEVVDAVGLTLPEYAQVRSQMRLGPLFTTSNAGHCQEQYLLLVHRQSGLTCLADLKGRSLNLQYSARLCLTPQWLDLLLLRAGFKPANEFFGKVNQAPKLSKMLLPVFFHQVDACVVSRSGLDTMKELNPQIGQQLTTLAASPEVVPVILAFRSNYNPPFKADLMATLNGLHQGPAGAQILNIFQSERLLEQPPAFFEPTLELVAEHARAVAGRSTAGLAGAPQAQSSARRDLP